MQGCHGWICHPGICGVQPGAEEGCCYCLSATSTAGRYWLVETHNNLILQIHHYSGTVHHGRSEMLCTTSNLASTHSSNASAAQYSSIIQKCCQDGCVHCFYVAHDQHKVYACTLWLTGCFVLRLIHKCMRICTSNNVSLGL